jgi:N utilization substance protein A
MFGALEEAMSSAARKYYHDKAVVTAHRPQDRRDDGDSRRTVVAELDTESEEPPPQILLDEARELVGKRTSAGDIRILRPEPRARSRSKSPRVQLGDEIRSTASRRPGRIAAQTAKQVLYQKVREAERDNIYNEYFPKIGELMNGTVKRFERGDMIVDLGKTEAVIPRDQQSRGALRAGGADPRRLHDVHKNPKGPQLVLSRTDPRPPDPPLRDGSAGDLRRHRRHQGGGAPAGRARKDRGPLPRARRRSGRRLRRNAREPGPVDHARAARREDRRDPLLG